MKTKHTKGKWMVAIIGKTLEGKDKFQIVADIPYYGLMGGDTETPLCDMFQFGSHKEAEANSKLMAAAPELLESLELVLNHCNKISAAHGQDIYNKMMTHKCIEMAEEAIQKATS